MTALVRATLDRHHFTVLYTPWNSRIAEDDNRDVLALMRTLLSEVGLPAHE
jgi:hypothetical protein